MLVFGGLPCHDGVAYSLDLTEMNWSIIDNIQFIRNGHSANLIANSVYLFGGYYIDYYNDIHKYDLEKQTLEEVKTTGNIPSKRGRHGSAVINQNLYIFGGSTGIYDDHDHTLYSLNTNSSEWVAIPITTDSFPSPR